MKISKSYSFDSSHILPRHKGKCGRLHGHTYEVGIELEGDINKETQFVVDYNEIDKIMNPIIERWDHQHLNLFIKYPSAENIATALAYKLNHLLLSIVSNGFRSLIISVSETPKTIAIWNSNIDRARLFGQDGDDEWKEPDIFNQVELDVENYFRRFSNESIKNSISSSSK